MTEENLKYACDCVRQLQARAMARGVDWEDELQSEWEARRTELFAAPESDDGVHPMSRSRSDYSSSDDDEMFADMMLSEGFQPDAWERPGFDADTDAAPDVHELAIEREVAEEEREI
jgi:hypothetical protein